MPSPGGFIGGGANNCIDSSISSASSYGVIAGGVVNTICAGANSSAILGGSSNTVSGSGSSILGGTLNTASGNCSSILGGSGDNDNGLSYAGIFGQNINNPLHMSANTFHVNCLNAISTPSGPGFFASGTIYYIVGTPPPGSKALYIM